MSFRKFFCVVFLLILFPSLGWSASIKSVKGKKVLIQLEGASSAAGEEYFLIDPATTKRRAIIRIRQVRGDQAIAEILKGQAQSGYTLQAKARSENGGRSETGASARLSDQREEILTAGSKKFSLIAKNSYGVLGSYFSHSMSAKFLASPGRMASSSMSGSGFGVGGFYDHSLSDKLMGRAHVSYEQFNTQGSTPHTDCDGSTTCDVKINYLSMYGLAKYNLTSSRYRLWIGGGVGFLLAMSKSSTVLNASEISTNQVFTAALGTDVYWSSKNYIPVSLEYNLFPASSTVTASSIALRAGWAWSL